MHGIIPVIDLKRGQVVHAVAGHRDEYQPIQSCLAEDATPSAISRAFRQRGFDTVYVADLDAITNEGSNSSVYAEIQNEGLAIWLDRGITNAAAAADCLKAGIARIIIGLESIEYSNQISNVLSVTGVDKAIVSLDMKDGSVLTRCESWREKPVKDVAFRLIEMGVRNVILLDLCRVGTGRGTGTESLCQQIKQSHPNVSVIVGGGVSSEGDVKQLLHGGADHVLVSTALHRGRL